MKFKYEIYCIEKELKEIYKDFLPRYQWKTLEEYNVD